MNGLLSHAPSPIAVRLAVGGLMLGQAQALIVFAAPGPIANSPRSLIVVLSRLSLLSLVGANLGVGRPDPRASWRRYRRGTCSRYQSSARVAVAHQVDARFWAFSIHRT